MDQKTRKCLPFPPEIRNRIYEFLFAMSYDLGLKVNVNNCFLSYDTVPQGGTYDQMGPTSLDLSLLLVSRQTYQEACGIFYRINRLDFPNTSELCTFVRKIGPRRCRSITSVTFGLGSDAVFEAIELLKTCDDLAAIEVRVSNLQNSDDLNALCTLRGMNSVEITLAQCPYPRSIGPICYCDGPRFDIQEMKRLIMSPRPCPA